MPELPDITVYIEALEERTLGKTIEAVRLNSPFLLRTIEPPLSAFTCQRVRRYRRLGKRIAMGVEGGQWLVIHLMIAGRLHWKAKSAKLPGKNALMAIDFEHGSLTLTEAGTKRRASLHAVADEASLNALDPGGVDVYSATPCEFAAALRRENHTLKRALTDPHIFSGIGNAYSDEILHAARLSPIALTQKLTGEEVERLRAATLSALNKWTDLLRREAGGKFPEKVTAFRDSMAAHGRYELPCPACGEKIQRIRYAENETNYCPRCQTGGKLLADRALSRLLGKDWPRTIEELETRRAGT